MIQFSIIRACFKTVYLRLPIFYEAAMYDYNESSARWNERAITWNEKLKDRAFYVNRDEGYKRYLDFLDEQFNEEIRFPAKKILDLGTGTGAVADRVKNLYPKASVIGIDGADEMLNIAIKNIDSVIFIKGNVMELSSFIPESGIDIVLTRGILLSHFGHDIGSIFLEQVKEVLNIGGRFIFDCLGAEWNKIHCENLPKTYYYLTELDELLNFYGFSRIAEEGNDRRTWNCHYRKD